MMSQSSKFFSLTRGYMLPLADVCIPLYYIFQYIMSDVIYIGGESTLEAFYLI